jgi:hypothetical protein
MPKKRWHLDHRRFFFQVRNTKEFASRRRTKTQSTRIRHAALQY